MIWKPIHVLKDLVFAWSSLLMSIPIASLLYAFLAVNKASEMLQILLPFGAMLAFLSVIYSRSLWIETLLQVNIPQVLSKGYLSNTERKHSLKVALALLLLVMVLGLGLVSTLVLGPILVSLLGRWDRLILSGLVMVEVLVALFVFFYIGPLENLARRLKWPEEWVKALTRAEQDVGLLLFYILLWIAFFVVLLLLLGAILIVFNVFTSLLITTEKRATDQEFGLLGVASVIVIPPLGLWLVQVGLLRALPIWIYVLLQQLSNVQARMRDLVRFLADEHSLAVQVKIRLTLGVELVRAIGIGLVLLVGLPIFLVVMLWLKLKPHEGNLA